MHLLLISSSNVHGYGYLDHAEEEIRRHLDGRTRLAFVPFAVADCEGYTAKIRERLSRIGLVTREVRRRADLDGADALFIGGGNTWRLLKTLHELDLVTAIRERVEAGLPYVGSSAGSNIAAPSIRTTNDMPIVQPPTFEALSLVPYQINPHYLDPDPSSTHMGETREQRLNEYLEENELPVIAIREGTMLRVDGAMTTVVGTRPGRIFRRGAPPVEVEPGTMLNGDLQIVK